MFSVKNYSMRLNLKCIALVVFSILTSCSVDNHNQDANQGNHPIYFSPPLWLHGAWAEEFIGDPSVHMQMDFEKDRFCFSYGKQLTCFDQYNISSGLHGTGVPQIKEKTTEVSYQIEFVYPEKTYYYRLVKLEENYIKFNFNNSDIGYAIILKKFD